MNIIQVLDIIEDIAGGIPAVKSFMRCDAYTGWSGAFNIKGGVKYGSVCVGIRDVTLEENMERWSIVVYYGDRLMNDASNLLDVQREGIDALRRIAVGFRTQYSYGDISGEVVITPFEQKFADYLAGAYMNLTLLLPGEGDC